MTRRGNHPCSVAGLPIRCRRVPWPSIPHSFSATAIDPSPLPVQPFSPFPARIAPFIGFLLAMYFLVGRWSFGRLDGSLDAAPLIEQPRVWIVALLVPLVVLLRCGSTSANLRSRVMSVDVAIFVFLAYMIISSCWSPSSELAAEKAIEMSLLLTVALSISVARPATTHDELERGLWWTIVLTGILMAALAILERSEGRIHAPGGGPNTFGRNMGLMFLGAAYLASTYGAKAKPACVAAMVIALLLVLLCGSRGALLATIVGAFVLLITVRGSLITKLATAAFTAVIGLTLLFNTGMGNSALDVFQTRIVDTTIHDRYLAARDDLWLDAVDWAIERPWFGWGLNGYRANSWTYPHNMFLEVIVEGGVVGLLLLLNIARAWFSEIRRHAFRVPRVPLAALALTFTAAQTSGDLFDSRGVFLMVTLSVPQVAALRRTAFQHRTRLALSHPH